MGLAALLKDTTPFWVAKPLVNSSKLSKSLIFAFYDNCSRVIQKGRGSTFEEYHTLLSCTTKFKIWKAKSWVSSHLVKAPVVKVDLAATTQQLTQHNNDCIRRPEWQRSLKMMEHLITYTQYAAIKWWIHVYTLKL